MESKVTAEQPAPTSCNSDQQQLIEKLCSDYRRNLIRRFQESKEGDSIKRPPADVLGVNALIAEHFHTHGYFISQSVFSAEIELPASGNEANYRLKQSDIEEIVGALVLPWKAKEIGQLIERYNKDTRRSLLSTLLANNSPKETSQRDLTAFNKYLKILVSRIAKVSLILTQLKQKRLEMHKPASKHGKSRRNRRANSQIHELAKKIDKLANRLTAVTIHTQPDDGKEMTFIAAKSYRGWIKELRESRHGQRMIRKIERIIVNSLNKEQAAMQRNFDEKLETQRMIQKLHYKQKFLEHFQALNLSNEPSSSMFARKHPLSDANGLPSRVVKSPMRKRHEKRERVSGHGKPSSESSARESKENIKVHNLISKSGRDRGRTKKEANDETVVQDRNIRLKNVERLIEDAKHRIKLLQSENERLDQTFNTYMERQSSQATNMQKDMSAVWASYNVDRLLLEKKRSQEQQPPLLPAVSKLQSVIVVPEIRVEKCKSNLEVGTGGKKLETCLEKTPKLQDNKSTGGGDDGVSIPSLVAKDNSSGEFSNPFINFDVKKFLESTTKHEKDQEGLSKSTE